MEDDDHAQEYAAHAKAREKVKAMLNALENAFPSHDHGETYAAQFTAARSEMDASLDAFAGLLAPAPPPE